jgi:hypothetical protein
MPADANQLAWARIVASFFEVWGLWALKAPLQQVNEGVE